MIFVTATPKWRCADGDGLVDNFTFPANITTMKTCTNANGTACQKYEFDKDMRTIVSEVSYEPSYLVYTYKYFTRECFVATKSCLVNVILLYVLCKTTP